MERRIVGYHQDSFEDWVAELDCFHNQHVRHKPPFTNRPWVVTEEGREARIGSVLNCVHCERLEMPERVDPYKRTPVYTETTIPRGLLERHATKKGVWGRISVLSGKLEYTVENSKNETIVMTAGERVGIPPEVRHSVKSDGAVRFYIEFCTRQT